MLFAAGVDAFAFSAEAVVLVSCGLFPAFLGFSSSLLELSDELLLLLLEAAAFFPTVAFAALGDLVDGFTAGFFSSLLLELSGSEVSALGAGVEGLDTGLPTLPANLAGAPFFSSSELLELLSELLCAFFVATCDFFVAGVAALVVGFTGAFSSELSESRTEKNKQG